MEVENAVFTGKQFFSYFMGYSPKTAEGKMYSPRC